MSNKKYPTEFKVEAVKRLENRGERTVNDVCEALGVGQSLLYRWRAQYSEQAKAANGPSESTEQANLRLQRENQELRRDRDALLKSIAVFVKDRK